MTDRKSDDAVEWAISAVQGLLNPLVLSRSELCQFAGLYGPYRLGVVGDRLECHKGRTQCAMIPIGDDTFLLDGIFWERLRFSRDRAGRIVTLVVVTRDGPVCAYAKEE